MLLRVLLSIIVLILLYSWQDYKSLSYGSTAPLRRLLLRKSDFSSKALWLELFQYIDLHSPCIKCMSDSKMPPYYSHYNSCAHT